MDARLWIYCPICRGQFDHGMGYGRECRCCSRECHDEFQKRYAGMIVGKERDPEEWLREKVLRAVVAALDPPPLKVGDRVEHEADSLATGVVIEGEEDGFVLVRWDNDTEEEMALADLRRVEEEKP